MSANLLYRSIVKLKHILDHLIFSGINGTLFASCRHHHTDFFLCYLLFLLRINTDQTKQAISRNGQNPYNGSENLRHHGKNPGKGQGNRFCFLHCHSLGDQFAKDDTEIGNDQCDHTDADRL